jgi:hypothetical protein
VGVAPAREKAQYSKLAEDVSAACSLDDSTWIDRILTAQFSGSVHTIDSLFKDTQYRVLESTLDSTLKEVKRLFSPGLRSFASVARAVDEVPSPLPMTLRSLAELLFDFDLRNELTSEKMDAIVVKETVRDSQLLGINLDVQRLGYLYGKILEQKMRTVMSRTEDTALMNQLTEMLGLARSISLPVNLHRMQTRYYGLLQTVYPGITLKAGAGDRTAGEQAAVFKALGEALRVRVG